MKITKKPFFAVSFIAPISLVIINQAVFSISNWVQIGALIFGALCFAIAVLIGDDVIEIPPRHTTKSN